MDWGAKIDGKVVKFFHTNTGAVQKTFNCAAYKGALSVNIAGEIATITCGDGKARVFDIHTGTVKRTV